MNIQIPPPMHPSQQPVQPQQSTMSSQTKKFLIAFFILDLLIVAGFLLYFFGFDFKNFRFEDTVQENIAVEREEDTGNPVDGVLAENVQNADEFVEYLVNQGAVVIDWNQGALPVAQTKANEILFAVNPEYRDKLPEGYEDNLESDGTSKKLIEIEMFEAGTLRVPESIEGTKLYYVFLPNVGMGIHYQSALVAYFEGENKLIHLKQTPDPRTSFRYDFDQWELFNQEVGYDFPELSAAPETLSITNKNVFLQKVDSYYPKNDGNTSIGDIIRKVSGNVGGVYAAQSQKVVSAADLGDVVANHDEYGPVYFDGDRYALRRADGSVFLYKVLPPFIQNKSPEDKALYTAQFTTNITWTGEVATVLSLENEFRYGGDIGTNGCGIDIVGMTDTVTESEWFNASNLIQIGRAANGDPIFELRDKATNPYYREFFDFGFGGYVYNTNLLDEQERERIQALPEEQKYQLYLNSYPMFFWQDGAEDWHVYIRNEYGTLAECGKPVIYLYPEQEMTANVRVAPNGGFTITDPEYPKERGWTVLAKPSGELTLLSSGEQYPYLFWEGHATGFTYPQEGFVFAKAEVPQAMRSVLTQAGLNEQETEDFMEYWEPKMMEKAYVRVHLAAQQDFEQAAPLKVTPQPDTTFRLFASIEPIDEFVDVPAMQLKPFERKGFTVVEWGGVYLQ